MTDLTYTDQLGRRITLTKTPERIVSLVPSQTELLYHLELDEAVVGITKFCVHPNNWFRSKVRVGGTKTVDIETARQLKPDLIIANKEENLREQIEVLESIAPVWVSDVNDLDDALEMINSVGSMVGKMTEATELIKLIGEGFGKLNEAVNTLPYQLTSAYLIWKDPYMTVGGDTFIGDMLNKCGFKNAFADRSRYPEVNLEQIKAAHCEIIFLSSEPYPFKEKHIEEIQHAVPESKVLLVDGEMFSWYGSRLKYAPEYFGKLLARR